MRSRLSWSTVLALLVALAAGGVATASQTDWNTSLRAFVGSIGGAPSDINPFMGVLPFATDGWDQGIDFRKPGEPFGEYLYAWFNRPSWGMGPIQGDFRSQIAEGASKVWGTGVADTFNIKVRIAQPPSGVMDPCGWDIEYPVGSAIYLTWVMGVGAGHDPPADYTFSLRYVGGINPKPVGTTPPGVSVPVLNQIWDMKLGDHIVLPLWDVQFTPPNAACDGFAGPDIARFKIIVSNPPPIPVCEVMVEPNAWQVPPATFTFTAVANGEAPLTFSWDFGDGGIAAGNPVAHTYHAIGTYTVTCTVADGNGDTGACRAKVTVSAEPNQPPTCAITYRPATPTTDDLITFHSGAADADGKVTSVQWDFGDGGAAHGDPASHQYTVAGTYTVTVTACDDGGLCATCTATVTVEAGVGGTICVNTNVPQACFTVRGPGGEHTGCGTSWCRDSLPAGPYTVTYAPVCGHYAPLPETRHLAAGGMVTFSGSYMPSGGVIHVDDDAAPPGNGSPRRPFNRIQDAIVVACDRDTVRVAPGRYRENIDFLGKSITVTSVAPRDRRIVAATIIDGGNAGSVVSFVSGEDQNSVLAGFTITNGQVASDGGGIRCDHSSPAIVHNVITRNATAGSGGGIWCSHASPHIAWNTVAENSAGWGAGICCRNSPAVIASNMVVGNVAPNVGGGIYCHGGPGDHFTIALTNNIVADNTTAHGGGGLTCLNCSAIITNCTIAHNGVTQFGASGIYCDSFASATIVNSIVWNSIFVDGASWSVVATHSDILGCWPGVGNICAYPQFVDPANGDYHLLPTSPCIDAGTGAGAPPHDIDGQPRPWPPDGRVDIGADEWLPACLCDTRIDYNHCAMPPGRVGQTKPGQIAAVNNSDNWPCAVVMRVTDSAGNVVFVTVQTLEPGGRVRIRFRHTFTAQEVGDRHWRFEVSPVSCADASPGDNVVFKRVRVRP